MGKGQQGLSGNFSSLNLFLIDWPKLSPLLFYPTVMPDDFARQQRAYGSVGLLLLLLLLLYYHYCYLPISLH